MITHRNETESEMIAKDLAVGSTVKLVDLRGQVFPLTEKVGLGRVERLLTVDNEPRAVVYFSRLGIIGSYPVEMLRCAA
jgi:hypothetical protein